tara:strand:+ start:248 stop:712 length:465 start_codon:yes stop_codon:yes gene_type:complete
MKVLKKFSNYKNGGKTEDDKKNKKSSLPDNTVFTGEKEKHFHHSYSGKPTADARKIEVEKIKIDGKEYWYSPQYDKKIPVSKAKDMAKRLPNFDKGEDRKIDMEDIFKGPFRPDKDKEKLTPEQKKKREEAFKKLMMKGGGTLMSRYNKKLKGE